MGIDFYNESTDLVKNNQDNYLNDKKLRNIDSITINKEPTSDNEVTNKKHVSDTTEEGTILRFNQTLENYLKVSVENDIYNLTKYDKIQISDTAKIKYPNTGSYLLDNCKTNCNDKNNKDKILKSYKSTKTISLTVDSGSTSLSPIGNSFMYIETSSNNNGNNVFVSFERTDNIQISNITFYYNRFSIPTKELLKTMGRFKIQLVLEDNTWSTRYNILKNDRFSNSSSEWTKLSLNFTEKNYGIKLIFHEIDRAHSDRCFSKTSIKHSTY